MYIIVGFDYNFTNSTFIRKSPGFVEQYLARGVRGVSSSCLLKSKGCFCLN